MKRCKYCQSVTMSDEDPNDFCFECRTHGSESEAKKQDVNFEDCKDLFDMLWKIKKR